MVLISGRHRSRLVASSSCRRASSRWCRVPHAPTATNEGLSEVSSEVAPPQPHAPSAISAAMPSRGGRSVPGWLGISAEVWLVLGRTATLALHGVAQRAYRRYRRFERRVRGLG